MVLLFDDRVDAGRRLAARLADLAGQPGLVVLGLPRGGVPVAAELARRLGGALDVLAVRKVGAPFEPELALGAIASGGGRHVNADLLRGLGISRAEFEAAARAEERELARRERTYRGERPAPALTGRTVVLVDDGVATGATMLAAIDAVRAARPALLVAAAPVMSRDARNAIDAAADRCEALEVPEPFYGVGAWYRDFGQLTDADVLAWLAPPRRTG